MKMCRFLVVFFCFQTFASFGQQEIPNTVLRSLEAHKTSSSVKIDGVLDELDWSKAQLTNGFTQRSPNPGMPASFDAEIRVLFDNEAIYMGAYIKDDRDSMSMQMTERDGLSNADCFGMIFCPYQDGINGVGFILTTQGVQFDTKYSAIGEDTNWDAVWDGDVSMVDDGWIVEMKIPYAALRFPDSDIQVWDINFFRRINRKQESSFWYPIDQNLNGFLNQTGQLNGIKDIKSPIRLSATPFVAGYFDHVKEGNEVRYPRGNSVRSFNAGMDIKYGLSDAFTLDMTLIPDFGEAQSDNQVLNLSPFEIEFDENRQFFTEGTELFNKGGLFYSRRAGGNPLHSADYFLKDGEQVYQSPLNAQLLNATKISGRTKKGTGLGFFNAVEGKAFATVGTDDFRREVEVNPLTNYNVMVVDQNLKNNSFVSVVNTNVSRVGDDYDANVTGMVFDLKNKDQSYSIEGGVAVSQQFFENQTRFDEHVDNLSFITDSEKDRLKNKNTEVLRGHIFGLGVNKISGKFGAGIDYTEESHTLDINDLGFQRVPNSRELELSASYREFSPFGKFNSMGGGVGVEFEWLYNPSAFASTRINGWTFAQTKSFWDFNVWGFVQPGIENQFYEPRTPGRFLVKPPKGIAGFNINTDTRKNYYFFMNGFGGGTMDLWDGNWAGLGGGLFYNVTDKISLTFDVERSFDEHDVGFVNRAGVNNEKIIMGQRRIVTTQNGLNGVYTFNKNMSLNVRLRHYWSHVDYGGFFELSEDGLLNPTSYDQEHDISLNFFNIDMVYRWRFAPGSDIFFIWKNAISDFSNNPQVIQTSYTSALGRLSDVNENNSLSLKLVYFLDYATLARG